MLLKITRILKCFLRDFLFLKTDYSFFLTTYNDGKSKPWRRKHNQRYKLEKLKKETIDTTIKDIRNIFRLEKENEVITDT